jgi:sulfite exporter TauE/SafE
MVLVGGLLGSAHCVGMCGGFALALGSGGHGFVLTLGRQIIYGLGRVFTYGVGGAVAGYGGARLSDSLTTLLNVQGMLSILAGLLLIVQGLSAAGVLRLPQFTRNGPCLGPGFFASLLRETRLRSVFLGGVINGLLPCGLVYAYLALAASSGDVGRGGLTMILFGLGTLPVLALVGSGGRMLSLTARRHVLTIAAWCVVLTGVISIGRGVEAMRHVQQPEAACPFCQGETTE